MPYSRDTGAEDERDIVKIVRIAQFEREEERIER